MTDLEISDDVEILTGNFGCLIWSSMHQINIESVEANRFRMLNHCDSLIPVVDATKCSQYLPVKALDAN